MHLGVNVNTFWGSAKKLSALGKALGKTVDAFGQLFFVVKPEMSPGVKPGMEPYSPVSLFFWNIFG